MTLASRHFKQTLTYWAPSATTDVNGKPTSSAPRLVSCRWEDRQEQLKNKEGEEVISKSRVFVDGSEDIDIDGYVLLGESADTSPPSDAREIQAMGEMPDLRAVRKLKTLYL